MIAEDGLDRGDSCREPADLPAVDRCDRFGCIAATLARMRTACHWASDESFLRARAARFSRRQDRRIKPATKASAGRLAGRLGGDRRLSGDGDQDVEQLVVAKTIIVAEAKDFELARTPAELANEAEDLLTGDKSAAHKLGRRADWIRGHLALVLRHFGVLDNPAGWRVLPVIVTSMNLLTPRVLQASIPVVTVPELPSWFRQQSNRRQRRHQRK